MAYDPENGYLYVANLEGHDVYVISTENYHVVSVIPVGRNPDYVKEALELLREDKVYFETSLVPPNISQQLWDFNVT